MSYTPPYQITPAILSLVEQIGEALGLSPKTAASRYRDALDELRTTLSEDLV